MNNDSFLIEEYDLDIAREVCKLIKDPVLRNRAASDVAATAFAKKYFQDCEIDTKSGLHNISQVLEDISISDIYIKDNYIDVRLYFNDNEIFVPKAHFDNNLLPVAYMFIKVGTDLSNGVVTGFITPALIDTTKEIDGYYHINEDDLLSYYDVENSLINKFTEDLPENMDSLIFDYLDNKLSDKESFYQMLIDSKEARIKLQNAAKAQIVFNYVSIPSEDTIDSKDEIETPALNDYEPVDLVEDAPEAFETLEEYDSNLSLTEEPVLGELSGNDEIETFELEEAETLDLADTSDTVEFDVQEDTLDEVEPLSAEPDIESSETDESNEELENEVEENTSEELDSDVDADSIQMLGAGVYEEQSLSDFGYDELQENNIEQESDDITIGNVDSSELTFDEEEPVTLDIPETIKEEGTEIIINEATDVSEEVEEELKAEELIIIDDSEPDTDDDSFDFSTMVTPSLDTLEETEPEQEVDFTEELLKELPDESDEAERTEDTEKELSQISESEEHDIQENETEIENSEQIDTLFAQDENSQEVITVPKQKSKNVLLPILTVIIILATVGYYSYTKFGGQQTSLPDIVDKNQNEIHPTETAEATKPVEDAMPVETVENLKVQLNTNEGNTISIPAIEQNLDASIAVSNLRVEFEIPAGYKASKTAERYFTKMGKILQLNLKTELLLLTRQPITNKIAVELEFNKSTQKFDVKGLVASSGEKSIDELILQTVKNAFNINLNMNMNIFGNVAGNPVLVIKL